MNSGFLHGMTPDGREGTPPPELQQGDLQLAAKQAGCELQLDIPDEGSTHITNENEIPKYEMNPPTSGDFVFHQIGAFLRSSAYSSKGTRSA